MTDETAPTSEAEKLARHDKEIIELRGDISSLGRSVDTMRDSVKTFIEGQTKSWEAQRTENKEILSGIRALEKRQGATGRFSTGQIITFVTFVLTIVAMAAGNLIYTENMRAVGLQKQINANKEAIVVERHAREREVDLVKEIRKGP